jgi:ABC-type uncharacterized transport system permease subunit
MSRYYTALGIQTIKEAAAYRTNFILSFLVVLIPLVVSYSLPNLYIPEVTKLELGN